MKYENKPECGGDCMECPHAVVGSNGIIYCYKFKRFIRFRSDDGDTHHNSF